MSLREVGSSTADAVGSIVDAKDEVTILFDFSSLLFGPEYL